jgi:Cu+-exporting ATPase
VNDDYFEVEDFEEISGKGYQGKERNYLQNRFSKIHGTGISNLETAVYISKNNEFIGKFIFKNEYRKNLMNF